MKFILSILTLLFIAANGFAQGVLEAKKTTIELKNLKADNLPTTVTYTVKNKGNQPVIITRVVPMSSQFKADWDKQPLAPGKSTDIRLSFTSANLQERFSIRTMVYSNARNNRLELGLSGNLVENPAKPDLLYKSDISGIKFKKNNLRFNKIYTWQTASDTAYFINARTDTVNLSIHYQPRHIRSQAVPSRIAPGQKGMLIITYDATQKNDYGYVYETVILSINEDKSYKNRLSITANLSEDFSKLSEKELKNAPVAIFDKKEINFGDIKPGEKADCDFTLTNNGKSQLLIRKTKASCGCTAVALGENSIAPGQSTVIRATFDSKGKSGRQYKSITVITNDPKNPETVLNINGNITN